MDGSRVDGSCLQDPSAAPAVIDTRGSVASVVRFSVTLKKKSAHEIRLESAN